MKFKKGHIMSQEMRDKISKKLKGRKKTLATLIKMSKAQKGKKITEETKRKISLANKGKKRTKEALERMSKAQRGNKSNTWKGGITPLYISIRNNIKTRQWRADIFERDNYICQKCFKKGGKLNAHHIKYFSIIMNEYNIKTLEKALECEELWNINNGKTLCERCHKNIHMK